MRWWGAIFCLFLAFGCGGTDQTPADAETFADARTRDADPHVDAQPADGEPVDAGTFPDADPIVDADPILDAQTPDAEPLPDAQAPDAFAPDALAPDAAAPDALAPDALAADAAAPDLGSADAGAIDSSIYTGSGPTPPCALSAASPPDAGPRPDGGEYLGPPGWGGLQIITNTITGVEGAGAEDFDNNGLTDIAVTMPAGTAIYYRLPPLWVRTNVSTIAGTRMITADADNDGDRDILLLRSTSLDWLENTGATLPWPLHTIASVSAQELAIGDVTGDGLFDVATSGPSGLRLHTRTGTIWTQRTLSSGDRRGVIIGDANNDGWPDVAAVRHFSCAQNLGACESLATYLAAHCAGGQLLFTELLGYDEPYSPWPMPNPLWLRSPVLANVDNDPDIELNATVRWFDQGANDFGLVVWDQSPIGWTSARNDAFAIYNGYTMYIHGDYGQPDTLIRGHFNADPKEDLVFEANAHFGGAHGQMLFQNITFPFAQFLRSQGWGWLDNPIVAFFLIDLNGDGRQDLVSVGPRGIFWAPRL